MGNSSDLWSPENEDIFVQLLVQGVNTGDIVDGAVSHDTWNEIYDSMRAMTCREFPMDQLLIKFCRLRQNHWEFSDRLTHEAGFGWDPITNTVDGTEAQWQNYLWVNS
jgi:hypothetical protein